MHNLFKEKKRMLMHTNIALLTIRSSHSCFTLTIPTLNILDALNKFFRDGNGTGFLWESHSLPSPCGWLGEAENYKKQNESSSSLQQKET